MYEYRATVIDHHDGDTSHVLVDLGIDVQIHLTVRWYGINAPELATDAGKASLAAMAAKFPAGTVCTLQTQKDHTEKYGRYLGTFILDDGTNMNQWMVAQNLAVPFMVGAS